MSDISRKEVGKVAGFEGGTHTKKGFFVVVCSLFSFFFFQSLDYEVGESQVTSLALGTIPYFALIFFR